MKVKEKFEWDEESGLASCIYEVDGRKFVGTAQCHEDDMDMKSKLTGLSIARMRATLEYLRYERDKAYSAYKAYDILLKDIISCKAHNEKSLEFKRLKYMRDVNYEDYKTLQKIARELYNDIGNTINVKNDLYVKLRTMRAGQKSSNE